MDKSLLPPLKMPVLSPMPGAGEVNVTIGEERIEEVSQAESLSRIVSGVEHQAQSVFSSVRIVYSNFTDLEFQDAEMEEEFAQDFVQRNISASLKRIGILLVMALGFVVVRVLDFTKERGRVPESTLKMSIGIQLACVLISCALVGSLFFKKAQMYMQRFLMVTVMLSITAILLTTQVGSNQLLKKWPLNGILVLLGISSVMLRLQFKFCMAITVLTNIAYSILLFANQSYPEGTGIRWTDFFATMLTLYTLSAIFVSGAYNNETIMRQQFKKSFRVQRENRRLRDKLKKTGQGRRTVDIDSPLEKTIRLLTKILSDAKDSNSMSQGEQDELQKAIENLGSNAQTLLAPRLNKNASQGSLLQYLLMDFHSKGAGTHEGGGNVRSASVAALDRRAPLKLSRSQTQLMKTSVLDTVVASLPDWNLDYFDIDNRSDGHALVIVGSAVFETHRLLRKLRINAKVFTAFITAIEKSYKPVPYHSRIHGRHLQFSYLHRSQNDDCFL